MKAAKAGKTVDPDRLAAAASLLASHHGTRGAASDGMAPSSSRNVPWHRVGRNGKPCPTPGDDDWRCDKCTDKLEADDMPWFCRHQLDRCPKCGTKKPKNATPFKKTGIGKATAVAKAKSKAKGGPKAPAAQAGGGGGGNAGQGGKATDESKRIKELERKLTAAEEQIQEREDEFQDAEEEHDDAAEEGATEWQEQLDAARQEHKELQKKLKEAKSPNLVAKWERRIAANKEECDDLQAKVWSAQNPQEQLEKKAAKSRRLTEGQPALLERVREASEKQQKALEEASKHEADAKRLADLWTKNGKEIIRLNSEAHDVLRGVRQADTDIGQYISASLNEKFKVFQDPVFAGDSTVVAKSREFNAAREAITAATAQLEAVCGSLVEYAAMCKTRAVEEAERKATEAAEQAEEIKRAAATPLPPGGEKEDEPKSDDQPKAEAHAATGHGKADTDTKTSEANGDKARAGDKSRSPPPRRGSAAAASDTATTTLDRALSKPARARTGEEVILAASAGKIGRWADANHMDDEEL